MEQLRCIAIDDEPLALELIKTYVVRFPSLLLLGAFEDALYASEYMKSHPVDLLFVDINMPDISGIELVKSLDRKPMVVFTTAYKNFAHEGFDLEALDYLVKPIAIDRFSRAIEKALDYHKYKTAEATQTKLEKLYVYSEYKMIGINIDDIEYIESMEDYIKIHLLSEPKPILTLMPLKKVLDKLPYDRFKRIHRSFIVAVQQVRSIHNKKVQLKTIQLPIGQSYQDFVSNWPKQ